MNADLSHVLEELSPFADLGTDPPSYFRDGNRSKIRMVRNGEELELLFQKNHDRITERSLETGQTRNHISYRALLASDDFGNLRQWQDHQKRSLSSLKSDFEAGIRVTGLLSGDQSTLDVNKFDEYLVDQPFDHERSVKVMLIDGPAGIGKTRFIEFLAWRRAEHYLAGRRPLVLHVQSRGRVLTFLQDLIAYSLQSLRLSVTFDQLPVLVRHGLVTLAIDGFDELADPNGYELAWGQVNDLVDQVRGNGTLILAGRETFIGHRRVRNSITSLNEDDDLRVLTLQPPRPKDAKQWLKSRGATMPEFADDLFEPHSFALRPFFLTQLWRLASTMKLDPADGGYLLTSLIDAMIEREASKFGARVNEVLDEEQLRSYVRKLLREAARFIADDQTEAIDRTMLAWVVDMAVPEDLDQEIVGILKNRAAAIAFLENDDTPHHLRFSHSKLLNHFLCEDVVDSVVDNELPKYVRRNLLGSDFLATFSDFVIHLARFEADLVHRFFDAASEQTRSYLTIDRGARNLGAMLVTMLPSMEGVEPLSLRDLDVDEALIRGTTPPAEILGLAVNQLDIQGADIESLMFSTSHIDTLTVNDATVVSGSIPRPVRLHHRGEREDAVRDTVTVDHVSIADWLGNHRSTYDVLHADTGLVPREFRSHPIMKLLGRACRCGTFWIPTANSVTFYKFVADPRWPMIVALLEQHGLVRVVTNEARRTNYRSVHVRRRAVHIRNAMGILNEDESDERIRGFYESLVEWIRKSEGHG